MPTAARPSLHGRPVVFVDGVRTPFGRAKPDGLYAHTRADDLAVKTVLEHGLDREVVRAGVGVQTVRELLRRHPALPPERVDDVAIAATTQAGDQGLTLGRTVGVLAGLPRTVPGFAIDRMCAGAMTAVTTTASAIGIGAQDVTLAGGVEHMGRHPMGFDADPNPRFMAERLVDGEALNMGCTAENLHDRDPGLTRDRADAYGAASQRKYAEALAAGRITPDVVPVALRDPARGWGLATADEPPRPGATIEQIRALPTPFRAGGRVTAGTAAPLTDGAAMCLLAAEDTAEELGLGVRMRMVSFAYAGVDPAVMGLGPVPSTEKALQRAGLTVDDIGLFEINEAFAVQVLAFCDAFGISEDDERVNPYGGAIAVGHPLASSGVRLMTQLARQFAERPDVRYGLTTMCVGLGQGGTVICENPHHADYAGWTGPTTTGEAAR
jgi:acetyl-CoA acyltransferase